MQLVKMRSYWSKVGPDLYPHAKGKFGHGHTHTQYHVNMKAQIVVMFLQAKKLQRLSAWN